MTEQVLVFGTSKNLVGLLTQPSGQKEYPVAFVMWNVGINHRVGPYRVFTQLARRLASLGFTALRFDVSGLGDSEVARSDRRPEAERPAGDVRMAFDAIAARTGIERFVVIGFCSGVDAAHKLALEDERVVGAAFLEGYAFQTRGFRMRYPKRFFNRQRWERRLRMHWPRLFGEVPGWEQQLMARESIYERNYPTPEEFGREVRTMATRGKQLLFVYVGGESSYAYREQLFEHTGRGDFERMIDLDFFGDADHTFFCEADRKRMVERVLSWARERFSLVSPASSDD